MQRPGDSYEPGHQHEPNSQVIAAHIIVILSVKIAKRSRGGWGRNRTGVRGVAVRCMTTLPPSLIGELERETGFEPATSTLARLRSTN